MNHFDADLYLAAICAVVPGLGRKNVLRLVQMLGSERDVFEADAKTLLATGLVTQTAAANFTARRRDSLPAEIDYFCRHVGVQLVTVRSAAYPSILRECSDKPLVLYVRGTLPAADYPVAVVGSRAATPYGVKAATYFAAALARAGVPIISGGARGIDAAAHEAAIKAGGTTVAVLGSGLDNPYPDENIPLFRRIAEQGAVITEFAPGMPPMAQNFPARNRIIVGLSRAVLVVEAAKRSGALITANIAADENKDVFCVPGSIFERTSAGCHDLLRTGAHLADSPNDILDERKSWRQAMQVRVLQPSMFAFDDAENDSAQEHVADTQHEKEADIQKEIDTTIHKKQSTQSTAAAEENKENRKENENRNLSALSKKILQLLRGGALSLEQLVMQSGASFTELSVELLELQVAGLVATDQAQRYYRE